MKKKFLAMAIALTVTLFIAMPVYGAPGKGGPFIPNSLPICIEALKTNYDIIDETPPIAEEYLPILLIADDYTA